MDPLSLFNTKDAAAKNLATRDEIAELLRTTPEALEEFEAAYKKEILDAGFDTGNLMDMTKKDVAGSDADPTALPYELIDKIVDELMPQAEFIEWDGEKLTRGIPSSTPWTKTDSTALATPVTNADICKLPMAIRPQLTGELMLTDMNTDSYPLLLTNYKMFVDGKTEDERRTGYYLFRQGLDILDLDPVLYAILGTNVNAMSKWLPPLVDAIQGQDFFAIPKTRIVRIPMTLLQLSRVGYETLTKTTKEIVNSFCYSAFNLDEDKEYFVKTGTYSSKYDFRNCYVHGAKEVRELGEYLLFIQHQAMMMACPLSEPVIYGASTTNEWVVREFIPDPENNPTIYKGLPLRTEYRVFIDCDSDEILGISPYWEPETMRKRFGHAPDASSPHQMHDYITYSLAEENLMMRYQENKDAVLSHVKELLPKLNLQGQWSLDIMQSGDKFWLIDMALACLSALNECIPANLLKKDVEIALPQIEAPTD